MVATGDVLCGRYVLQEKLGEGGMGTVYAAHDRELDRRVAVKLLPAAFIYDAEVTERFEREARMTAKLDHPNIVPIYDVGRADGRPFIVMKRLEGDTLAGLLRAKGALSAEEILSVMRQLALGIDFIHQNGFIHRDIKAGNIIVGTEGHTTILDFGILRNRDPSKSLTRQGMVMGTPHYMAPEQALGLSDIDHRADLYALGVVLFECLTGTLPFQADSELRLIQMQAHQAPPDLLERAPWVPKPVAAVMRRALAKRPEDRFSSAAELVRALEHAIAEVPGPLTPPLHGPGAATYLSWRKRDSSRLMPLAVVPLSIPPPLRQAAPQRAARRVLWGGAALAALAAGVGMLWLVPWANPPGGRAPTATQPVLPEDGFVIEDVQVVTTARGDDAGDATPEAADGGEPSGETGPGFSPTKSDPSRPPGKSSGSRRGRVRVTTTLSGEPWWADLFVDGARKGRTPSELELLPGRHVVRVERPGFKSQQREIVVASGKTSVVRIALHP
jgi:hypothetical protein